MRHPAAIEACRCSEETNEPPGDETTDYGTVFFKLITVMNEGPTATGNIVSGGNAEPGSYVTQPPESGPQPPQWGPPPNQWGAPNSLTLLLAGVNGPQALLPRDGLLRVLHQVVRDGDR